MSNDQREVWDKLYERKGELWSRKHDDWLESLDGESVLDLGCGTGKSIDGLKGHIVGVDHSLAALRLSKRRYESVDFLAADSARLPFKDDSFDLIRSSYLFGHLDERRIADTINEISRVLKKSGRLAVEVFSVNDERSGRGRPVSKNTYCDGDGILKRYFEPSEIDDMFSDFTKERLEIVDWKQRAGPRKELKRSTIRAIFRK
ncbi:MAG: class I SAM-dependent methyltransferase [Thermoplasmata archaeon]